MKAPKYKTVSKKRRVGKADGGVISLETQQTPDGYVAPAAKKKETSSGALGSVIKNAGLGYADSYLGAIGMGNVIGDDAYSGAGSDLAKKGSKVLGDVGKIALPVALSAFGVPPQATSAAQGALGSVNPQSPAVDTTQALPPSVDLSNMTNLSGMQSPEYKDWALNGGMKDGGTVTASKAKKILKDGTIRGVELTDKQKKYFGWIAGGSQDSGKADGGKVKGPGTAKSDSIDAKVAEGSFIVPAENAGEAQKIREKYLTTDDSKAKLNQKDGVNVPLSNGEHMFTPEEVVYLKAQGVDLTKLAPNAKENSKGKFDGTTDSGVTNSTDFMYDVDLDNLKKKLGVPTGSVAESKKLTPAQEKKMQEIYTAGQVGGIESLSAKQKVDLQKIYPNATTASNIPSTTTTTKKTAMPNNTLENVLAAGQVGLGLHSLLKDGKRPVDTLSPDYIDAVNSAKTAANYGFDPVTKAAYQNQLETARIGNLGLNYQTAGGNPMLANANARATTNAYTNNLVDLAVADASQKQKKTAYRDQMISNLMENKRRLFQDKLNAFNTNQEAGAELLNTGITNALGSNYNSNYLDALTSAANG